MKQTNKVHPGGANRSKSFIIPSDEDQHDLMNEDVDKYLGREIEKQQINISNPDISIEQYVLAGKNQSNIESIQNVFTSAQDSPEKLQKKATIIDINKQKQNGKHFTGETIRTTAISNTNVNYSPDVNPQSFRDRNGQKDGGLNKTKTLVNNGQSIDQALQKQISINSQNYTRAQMPQPQSVPGGLDELQNQRVTQIVNEFQHDEDMVFFRNREDQKYSSQENFIQILKEKASVESTNSYINHGTFDNPRKDDSRDDPTLLTAINRQNGPKIEVRRPSFKKFASSVQVQSFVNLNQNKKDMIGGRLITENIDDEDRLDSLQQSGVNTNRSGYRNRKKQGSKKSTDFSTKIKGVKKTQSKFINTKREDSSDQFEFPQDNKHEDDGEKTFLLDESYIKRTSKMPNVLASKSQLQKELGHYVQKGVETNHTQEDEVVQDESFYRIIDQDSIEVIEQYKDRCPLLGCRKTIMKIRVYISRLAYAIITHKIFETLSILVIVANCFFLALDDPTATDVNPIMNMSDYVFQGLYTIEMIFKICGLGFVFNKGSYMRDAWNILDFVIVVSGYATFLIGSGGGGTNISALRSFRVLRPLRTISGVEGLRVIVSALMSSLPLLGDAILVLLFFFFIFAIAGVQLFQGALKKQCFSEELGVIHPDLEVCGGGWACPSGYFCGKSNTNPNWGVTNCDNILYALLLIFQTVTLEGWSPIMQNFWQSMQVWVVVFFIPIIFIGSWFLLNLTLAVIKSKFTEEHKEKRKNKGPKKKKVRKPNPDDEEDEEERKKQIEEKKKDEMKKLEEEDQQDIIALKKQRQKELRRIKHLARKIDLMIRQREIRDKMSPIQSRRESIHSFESEKHEIKTNRGGNDLLAPIATNRTAPRRSMSSINKPGQGSSANIRRYNFGEGDGQLSARSQGRRRLGLRINVMNPIKVESFKERPLPMSTRRSRESKTPMQSELLQATKKQSLGRDQNQILDYNQIKKIQKESQKEFTKSLMKMIGDMEQTKCQKIDNAIYQEDLYKLNGYAEEQNIEYNKQSTQEEKDEKKMILEKDKKIYEKKDHFEISKLNKNQLVSKMKMTGMAGIKKKYDEPQKHEYWDRFAQDNDIFNFIDSSDSEETEEIQNLNKVDPIIQQELSKQQRDQRISEIKSKGINIKSLYEEFGPQDIVQKQESNIIEIATPKKKNGQDSQEINSAQIINSAYKRRQTITAKLKKFVPPVEEKEEEKKEVIKKPLKQRIKDFFRAAPEPQQNVHIDIVKLQKQITQGPQKLRDKAQQQKKLRDKSMQQTQPAMSPIIVEQKISEQQKSKSVKARSEMRKRQELMKMTVEFNERQREIQRKRNKYFAKSVRNIGKTRTQIQRESKIKKIKKRYLNLRGGFELTIEDIQQKKKQMKKRSASAIGLIKSRAPGRKPSLMTSDLLKQLAELKDEKLKQDIENEEDDDINDSSLDMDQILYKTKKKIVLKNKKYNFTSENDVLQIRQHHYKFDTNVDHEKIEETLRTHLERQLKKKLEIKQKKLEDELKSNKKRSKTLDAYKIFGYQKKIAMNQRQNFDELLAEEAKESDDNIDTIFERIQQDYNKPHRSNIHVTGTLSVVIDEHAEFKHIMNNNYFYNINEKQAQNVKAQISMFASSPVKNFAEDFGMPNEFRQFRRQESNVSYLSLADRGGRNDVGLNLVPASPRRVPSRNLSPLNSFRRKPTLNSPSNTNLRRLPTNGPGQFKTQNTLGSRTNVSQYGGGNTGKIEYLNDKQILKRLNHEYAKSRVFKDVAKISKLPQEIKGRPETFTKNKAVKKKKQIPTKENQYQDSEEIESELSDYEQKPLELDYYVDREKLNCENEVRKAKIEASQRPKDQIEWSGQDIMMRFDPYKVKIALGSLNTIRVWPQGLHGYIKRARTLLKNFMKGAFVDNLLMISVAANTVVLAVDHYGIDPTTQDILKKFNLFFTLLFASEMCLKITAIGIVKYLKDKMNYLDGGVVILSLVELMFTSGKTSFSAFRSVRMIRTLRVLRVARLLRGMKSMMNILSVISRSLSSFAYLAILLFLFIFIYALLGMQLFGGQFDFEEGVPKNNFDSFTNAFVTSFIILTMENWNSTMFYAMRSGTHFLIVIFYFVSWIFIGNYMLLNLFLSILLDSFTQVEEEDHETEAKKKEKQILQKEELLNKEGEEMINEITAMQNNKDGGGGGIAKTTKKKGKKKKNMKKKAESNMLDESIEIDLDTLQVKREQSIRKKPMFENIDCEYSFFIFTKKNKIRIFCYKVITHRFFESVIMVLIVLSSIKLIYDTYLWKLKEDDIRVDISGKIDYFFTTAFALESTLKSISMGLAMNQNSYLRESWNQLDFFIVLTSIIDACATNVNIPIVKILRLLRILRPLRFISHNSSMKTIVVALLQSLGAIFNVFIVVALVYLMFAILGVNLFMGKFQYCDIGEEGFHKVKNKEDCEVNYDGVWKTYNQNFDSVPNAMLTLFVLANQEGWPDIMNVAVDNNGFEKAPRPNASPQAAYFFVAFVFVGSFFFMNLFVGVIFMNFEAAQRDEKEALLLEYNELQWLDMMRMIVNTKPEIIKFPKNKISKWMQEFTKAESKFDFAIMMVIVLNMLTMALNYEGQTTQYTTGLDYINYIFTAVFTIEACFKIIAQGASYYNNSWNKFDFFVVSASFLDIAMGSLKGQSLKFLRVAPQLARVLRVLRVSRLFRLLNKYRGLQALLQTIMFSLPQLMNVLALLMLVFFIFAVLGVTMFGKIEEGNIINEYFNFANFGMAMIIIFRMSTGEDWPTIMYDTMKPQKCVEGFDKCASTIAPLYFFFFCMICQYVMLNLFILIILQQFELYYLPDDNVLQKFRDDLEKFKLTWNKYAKDHIGVKIREIDMVKFFKELKGNLSLDKGGNIPEKIVLRNILKMNLQPDEEGFIYFNELLFKAMKRVYGVEKTKKRVLAELEFNTLEKLEKIKVQMKKISRSKERYEAVSTNPFLMVMIHSMTFRAWLKAYNKNKEKRHIEKEEDPFMKRESSEEEEDDQSQQKKEDEYVYETEEDISIVEENKEEDASSDEFDNDDQDEDSFQSDESMQKVNNESLAKQIFINQKHEEASDMKQLKGFDLQFNLDSAGIQNNIQSQQFDDSPIKRIESIGTLRRGDGSPELLINATEESPVHRRKLIEGFKRVDSMQPLSQE